MFRESNECLEIAESVAVGVGKASTGMQNVVLSPMLSHTTDTSGGNCLHGLSRKPKHVIHVLVRAPHGGLAGSPPRLERLPPLTQMSSQRKLQPSSAFALLTKTPS